MTAGEKSLLLLPDTASQASLGSFKRGFENANKMLNGHLR